MACKIDTLFKFIFLLKKGPPDAVKYILWTTLVFLFSISFKIEKCSESIGINFVLFFFSSFDINFQAQIILSLFAIKIFFENLIILRVGIRPAIPEIAEMVISNFMLFNKFKSLIIIIFFFLQNVDILFIKTKLFE